MIFLESTNVFAQDSLTGTQAVTVVNEGQDNLIQAPSSFVPSINNGVPGTSLPEPIKLDDIFLAVGETGRADGPGADLIVKLNDLFEVSPAETGSIKVIVKDKDVVCAEHVVDCGTLFNAEVKLFTDSGKLVGSESTKSGVAEFNNLAPGVYVALASAEHFSSVKKEVVLGAGKDVSTVIYLEKEFDVRIAGDQDDSEKDDGVPESDSNVSNGSSDSGVSVNDVASSPTFVAKLELSLSNGKEAAGLVSLRVGESVKYGNYFLKFERVLARHTAGPSDEGVVYEAVFSVQYQDYPSLGNSPEPVLNMEPSPESSRNVREAYPVENIKVIEEQGKTIRETETNVEAVEGLVDTGRGSKTKVKENIVKSDNECSDGCVFEDHCVSYGLRIKNNGGAVYCDISGKFMAQKNEGESCQNDYECKTNQCSSGVCTDIVSELEQQRSILQKILSWFEKFF